MYHPTYGPTKRPLPTTPQTPAPTRLRLMNASEPLQVFCRIRPTEDESCIQVVNDSTIRLTIPESSVNFRPGVCREYSYSFKKIFTDIHNQKDVFQVVARPLLENLIKGKNGLLFAYGVTGGGKTHTMTGHDESVGILPRCLNVLFNTISDYQAKKYVFKPDGMNGFEVQSEYDALKEREEKGDNYLKPGKLNKNQASKALSDVKSKDESKLSFLEEDNAYSVFVTYIEIYNNTVYDLLEETYENDAAVKLQSKKIREDGAHNMYVQGVTEIEVKSVEEAYDIFRRGQKRKRREETNLNKESSRSHSIFTIRLVQAPFDIYGRHVLQHRRAISTSQLSLVDLAGSERADRTGNCRGQRLREAANINNSLMTLRSCLEILRENQQTGSTKNIPRRESSLTYLFRNFFDGGGDIRMIVCVNPRIADYDETIQVMKFAEVSQEIRLEPTTPAKLDAPAIGLTPGRRRAHQAQVNNEPIVHSPDGAVVINKCVLLEEIIPSTEQIPVPENNVDTLADLKSEEKWCKFLEEFEISMHGFDSRCDKFQEQLLKWEEDNKKYNAEVEAKLMELEEKENYAEATQKIPWDFIDFASTLRNKEQVTGDEMTHMAQLFFSGLRHMAKEVVVHNVTIGKSESDEEENDDRGTPVIHCTSRKRHLSEVENVMEPPTKIREVIGHQNRCVSTVKKISSKSQETRTVLFACAICPFLCSKNIRRHVRSNHPNDFYFCGDVMADQTRCQMWFYTAWQLQDHQRLEHERTFQENNGNMNTRTSKHYVPIISCKKCDEKVTSLASYAQHTRHKHPETLEYVCVWCSASFAKSRQLNAHQAGRKDTTTSLNKKCWPYRALMEGGWPAYLRALSIIVNEPLSLASNRFNEPHLRFLEEVHTKNKSLESIRSYFWKRASTGEECTDSARIRRRVALAPDPIVGGAYKRRAKKKECTSSSEEDESIDEMQRKRPRTNIDTTYRRHSYPKNSRKSKTTP